MNRRLWRVRLKSDKWETVIHLANQTGPLMHYAKYVLQTKSIPDDRAIFCFLITDESQGVHRFHQRAGPTSWCSQKGAAQNSVTTQGYEHSVWPLREGMISAK